MKHARLEVAEYRLMFNQDGDPAHYCLHSLSGDYAATGDIPWGLNPGIEDRINQANTIFVDANPDLVHK